MRLGPTIIIHATLALSLTGCSKVDKADNPPLLGQWQIEGQLISASLDGRALDEAEGKVLGLKRLNHSPEALGCMEPDLSRTETVLSTLPDKFKNECEMSGYDGSQEQFSATIKCQPKAPIKDASILIDGQAAADNASIRNAISIGIEESPGSTSRIEIVQRIKWTRLGDCS